MKIRGNTVGTNLKPEVILTNATALTEEQKAKARENIGAASVADVGNVDLSNYHTKEEALALFATNDYVHTMIDQSITELPVYDGTYREIYMGEVEDV